jgi:hypothetical protein
MTTSRTAIGTLLTALALLMAGVVVPQTASAAPAIGGCYDYSVTTIGKPSSAAPVIGCEFAHTAETFAVGAVTDGFGLPSTSKAAARLKAGLPCTVAAMNAYLGMPGRAVPSRFLPVTLFPTDDQWNAGERWVRCDLVLLGGSALTPITGTAAALVSATPQDQLNFCTSAQPKPMAKTAYPCVNPKKNWIKVLAAALGGPSAKFPGTDAVRKHALKICEKQGKKWGGRIDYPGWWAIYPKSPGWRQGQRLVHCYVPYGQYLKQVAINATPKPTPKPTPTPPPVPTPTADPTVAPAPVPTPDVSIAAGS